jgi:hypothetical protein
MGELSKKLGTLLDIAVIGLFITGLIGMVILGDGLGAIGGDGLTADAIGVMLCTPLGVRGALPT